MKTKTTFVIGNGFDLNLGLNTSYSDFLKKSIIPKLETLGGENKLLSHLYEIHKLNNWIDLEIQLKNWFGNLHSYESRQDAQNDFKFLVKLLKHFIKRINDEFIIDETVISTNAYKMLKRIGNADFIILNFNYTDTVWKVLKHIGLKDYEIENRIIHVHGNVSNEIILGVEDSARLNKNVTFIKKSGQFQTSPLDYNSILEISKRIIFFGHSLGESDFSYFSRFFRISPDNSGGKSEVIFNYYMENGWDDLYSNLDKLTDENYLRFIQYFDVIKYDVNDSIDYNFNDISKNPDFKFI